MRCSHDTEQVFRSPSHALRALNHPHKPHLQTCSSAWSHRGPSRSSPACDESRPPQRRALQRYTTISASPPIIGIGVTNRPGEAAVLRTSRVIRRTGEFVVNVVTEDIAHKMNICATDFSAEISKSRRPYSHPPRRKCAASPSGHTLPWSAASTPLSKSARSRIILGRVVASTYVEDTYGSAGPYIHADENAFHRPPQRPRQLRPNPRCLHQHLAHLWRDWQTKKRNAGAVTHSTRRALTGFTAAALRAGNHTRHQRAHSQCQDRPAQHQADPSPSPGRASPHRRAHPIDAGTPIASPIRIC